MKNFDIGFVVTKSGRWPKELGERRLAAYGQWIQDQFPNMKIHIFDRLLTSMEDCRACITEMQEAKIELLIQLYGAFTGDDICCTFADELKVPIILWAPREEAWVRQDRLYANALCSATMNGASLTRIHAPWHILYGNKEEDRVAKELKELLEAYRAKSQIRGMTYGLFGYRPTAFYNCAFDEVTIRRTFGINVEETDLKVVFDRMASYDDQKIAEDMAAVAQMWDTTALPEGHLENHARLYQALKELFKEQSYDYAAIKCWPEMGNLHTTPCAVLGRLADEGVTISCEGDMDAGLAALVENVLTNKPTFITDLINICEEENTVTFWHCGNAAPSLHNKADGVTMCNHPLLGQGTAFWCALKDGPVTAARFTNIDGQYRLFLLRGKAVPTVRNTRGSMVNVQVETPVLELVQKLAESGMSHHWSVVWEDVADCMVRLAKLWNIPVIEL